MQHSIPIDTLGTQGEIMANAVQACVHCGFCLPTCPTYRLLGEEMDSPHGRIFLMKEALEGNLALEETTPYVDRCLGCLACVRLSIGRGLRRPAGQLPRLCRTAAPRPAGQPTRAAAVDPPDTALHRPSSRGHQGWPAAASRWHSVLPDKLSAMVNLLPDRLPRPRRCPIFTPPRAHSRHGSRCWWAVCSRRWRRRSTGPRCGC